WLLLTPALLAAGCETTTDPEATTATAADVRTVSAETAVAVERPIARFVAVSGTLAAQEQADVAAEISGRIVSTPVERGTRVGAGAALVQIADAEVRAQADEAAANAAQIEARLGLAGGAAFEIDRVPEVANARASSDLAQLEFDRARMLVEQKLLPQADFDRSRAQADVARRQYDIARNGAEQQYQSLLAARARMTLARKALADTSVRAPFDGVVEQRLVSVGDYVTRGTKVASVMRINPMRLELTVPGQYMAAIAAGRSVSLQVDAYPGRTFTGRIRYVSPAVAADSRALVIEALVPNETGELKPGLFATARIEQAADTPAVLVPASAVRTDSGTARVYLVTATRTAEERLVTTGQTVGDLIEITSGVKAGDAVATSNVSSRSPSSAPSPSPGSGSTSSRTSISPRSS
ncbi:MAG: Efflux transporter periplasmic adaptor subunit, partial [Acidobacteria bacterium]|nr:Efflux transporter periplasmic adaptor subunit [Acidobacteriota bacterium]